MIHPRGFRLTSTVHHLEQVCWRAVPTVVLLTSLIRRISALGLGTTATPPKRAEQ